MKLIKTYHESGSNSKFIASFKIPIFFHNLKGYDSHLIIDKAYLFGARSLNIVPMSAEKDSSFQIGKLLFKDSMDFLNTALDNLINTLKNSRYDFPCLKKHCKYIKNHTDLDL